MCHPPSFPLRDRRSDTQLAGGSLAYDCSSKVMDLEVSRVVGPPEPACSVKQHFSCLQLPQQLRPMSAPMVHLLGLVARTLKPQFTEP